MVDYSQHFGQGGLNDRVDADRLVEEIGLDGQELERRKEFIGFDEDDARRLERFEEVFVAHADEIADMFYENLISQAGTREVLSRSPKGVEQLKRTQMAYLTTLAGGEYDLSYFRNRARIGKIHDVIEMPIKHYIGQYGVYYDLILPLVVDRITEDVSEAIAAHTTAAETDGGVVETEEDDPDHVLVDPATLEATVHDRIEEGLAELHSILKVLNLDMQVAADTYIHSYTEDVETERDRFATLFDNLPNPVAGVRLEDGESYVQQVNPAFEEVFGYTAEEFDGRSLENVLRPPDVEAQSLQDRSVSVDDVSGRPESEWDQLEVTLETVSGRREFVRISAPVDRKGVTEDEFAFFVDVTERKQRRQRLEVLSRTLRHDIRNQMNLVEGHASRLLGRLEGEERAIAAEIDAAADRLLSISEEARMAQRLIETETDGQPADVEALTAEVLEDARREYPECSFSASVSESLTVQGTGPVRIALEQVVENAVEHNDAEKPCVEVTAVPTLDGEYVDLRVADNGPGIPPAEYELFTGERDRSQIEHASGLGLWTVNWAVTNAGGDLLFDANSPRGTIVTLRLRRVDEGHDGQ